MKSQWVFVNLKKEKLLHKEKDHTFFSEEDLRRERTQREIKNMNHHQVTVTVCLHVCVETCEGDRSHENQRTNKPTV